RQVMKRSSSRYSYFRICWTAGVEIRCPRALTLRISSVQTSGRTEANGGRCDRCVLGWIDEMPGLNHLRRALRPGAVVAIDCIEPIISIASRPKTARGLATVQLTS